MQRCESPRAEGKEGTGARGHKGRWAQESKDERAQGWKGARAWGCKGWKAARLGYKGKRTLIRLCIWYYCPALYSMLLSSSVSSATVQLHICLHYPAPYLVPLSGYLYGTTIQLCIQCCYPALYPVPLSYSISGTIIQLSYPPPLSGSVSTATLRPRKSHLVKLSLSDIVLYQGESTFVLTHVSEYCNKNSTTYISLQLSNKTSIKWQYVWMFSSANVLLFCYSSNFEALRSVLEFQKCEILDGIEVRWIQESDKSLWLHVWIILLSTDYFW